jgi:hypothetical protein
MRRKRITDMQLFASYLFTDDYNYQSYLEDCEEMEVEPASEDSNDYWYWVSDRIQCDYDCFFDNLKHSKADSECYIITFSLGLWNSNPTGYIQKVFTNLGDAIKAALESSRDYLDYEVKFLNGAIQVCGAHHDGRNYFTIRQLSCLGKKWFDDEDVDWDDKVNRSRTFRKMDYYSLWETKEKPITV